MERSAASCWNRQSPMLHRYRKIQLIDEQGAERTLLLSKTAKFQIGTRYRLSLIHI